MAAQAVPVLQVATPAGPGDTGAYGDYVPSLLFPTETDTAVATTNTIYFAGVFQNNNVLSLGAANLAAGGSDWSSFDPSLSVLDGYGAIVVVAVPDGSLDASGNFVAGKNLTIDIGTLVYGSQTLSGFFPNNHDPLKDTVSDFLFFDIGDFSASINVLDYATETAGSQLGSVQTAQITATGLAWVHFDLMAIETSQTGHRIATTWENNPGSHDVTWKAMPEPGIVALLGGGLLGMTGVARRRRGPCTAA
jgi:hypothetical protein